MIVLDTSSLIRFFTNDIPQKASIVRRSLESEERIKIPDVVFPELEYVLLGKSYNSTRAKVFSACEFLVTKKNVIVSKEVKLALDYYEATNLDFADCIIAATAIGQKLLSFDNKLLSLINKKGFKN